VWVITTKWLQNGKQRNAECEQLKAQLEQKLEARCQQQVLQQKCCEVLCIIQNSA